MLSSLANLTVVLVAALGGIGTADDTTRQVDRTIKAWQQQPVRSDPTSVSCSTRVPGRRPLARMLGRKGGDEAHNVQLQLTLTKRDIDSNGLLTANAQTSISSRN